MGIILSCIKNSRFTIFFTILAAILGLYCYYILPKQESPDLAETTGLLLSISGDSLSQAEIKNYAQRLKNNLVQIDGVDRFEILGENQQEVLVKVDPLRLAASSLSFEELCNILKAQNLEIPSGSIKANDKLINVRVPGSLRSITDIENLLLGISPQTGTPLRLQDLATVSWSPLENNPQIHHPGHNAILLAGYFQADKNILVIGKELRKNWIKSNKRLLLD